MGVQKQSKWIWTSNQEGFQLTDKGNYVCKLKKSLCGLKQAPRAWYARIDSYLQVQGFKIGSVDSNLYYKIIGDYMIIVEVYVDDIIFGSDDEKLRILLVRCNKNMKCPFLVN